MTPAPLSGDVVEAHLAAALAAAAAAGQWATVGELSRALELRRVGRDVGPVNVVPIDRARRGGS